MNDVQLDKNSYSRRLRDECNQEGAVTCCAPPHNLLNAPDDEVLSFANQQGRLLLTFDRAIAFEWRDTLIHGFPGILILALEDNSVRRMSRKVATSLLRRFKSDCPAWPAFSCRNSVIELQPNLVFVYNVESQSLLLSTMLERNAPGWQDDLQKALAMNASRNYG
jgi:predicted nuclease of predicted toxin-antitoxin system